MKKYKKKPSKLLQIRLSEKEYDKTIEFINKFGVTHREWLSAVLDDLKEANLLIGGQFYTDWKSYAYWNRDKWDKTITDESVCEECGAGRPKDYNISKQLERHHYAGYIGENAFKVQILCRPCHSKKPKCFDKKEDLIKNNK